MSPIRIVTLSLLLTGMTSAQVKTGEAQPPKKADGATPPAAQGKEPDKKQEKPPTPVDTTKLLERSLEAAREERAFLEEVVKSGGLLRRFQKGRDLAQEMTEKFTPGLIGPALPQRKKARLLGDGEKEKLADDVLFTVESVPVTKQEYEQTLAYLRSYPHADSVASMETLAISTLVARKAGQGIHPEKSKVALQIIGEISKRVKEGQKFSDLAGQYSEDKASAENGGKRDYLVRGEMDPSYAESAFGLKVGQVSAVFAGRDGFHLVRVLGMKKGETPDKDRILTAHIVRYYTSDAESRAHTQRRVAEGKIDLAFRTDEMRKLAPAQFK